MKVSINSRQGSLPMSKKQSKLGKTNVAKPRKVLLLFATPLILVAMIVGGFYIKFQLDVISAQADMKEYLQNKYRQEFVVEKPEHKGGGFAVEGHFDAIAYPKDDKTIRFTVMSSSSGVSDGYAGAVWTSEERKRLQPVINKVFGERVQYEIDIQSSMSVQTRDINISGRVPLFNNAADRYGKQIPYDITISELRNRDLSTQEKMAAVNKLFLLTSELPAKTDTTITYKSAEYGREKHGLIISLEKLKTLDKSTIVNMFKRWEVVAT